MFGSPAWSPFPFLSSFCGRINEEQHFLRKKENGKKDSKRKKEKEGKEEKGVRKGRKDTGGVSEQVKKENERKILIRRKENLIRKQRKRAKRVKGRE